MQGTVTVSVLDSLPGTLYSLENSPDLIDWQEGSSDLPGTGGTMQFDSVPVAGESGFFRVNSRRPN